ncbi:hypothetical protein V8F06_000636 [Rhypophila decipiens]
MQHLIPVLRILFFMSSGRSGMFSPENRETSKILADYPWQDITADTVHSVDNRLSGTCPPYRCSIRRHGPVQPGSPCESPAVSHLKWDCMHIVGIYHICPRPYIIPFSLWRSKCGRR